MDNKTARYSYLTNQHNIDQLNNKHPKNELQHIEKSDPKFIDAFDREKTKVLLQLQTHSKDHSRAGSIDSEIVSFVETINSKPNYYTTSSCAGRLIIVLQPPTQLLHVTQWESECDRNNNENKNQTELQQQKKERLNVEWVYVTHEENSTHETMWKTISERLNTLQPHQNNHEIWFKLEPPILAIRTKDLPSAVLLLNYARSNHLKNSGIRSIGNDGRVNVTLIDTHRIETLLAIGNRILVTEEYFKTLVSLANIKLKISRQRFETLRLYLENKLN